MGSHDFASASTFAARRRAALRARDLFEHGGSGVSLDGALLDSWRRSRRSVPADLCSAPAQRAGTAVAEWRESRFAFACRDVLPHVAAISDRQGIVAALFDRHGDMVWQHAGAHLRRQLERLNFVPGGRWDEGSTGTTAPALALHGRPAEVFATEHYWSKLRDWACWAVPVLDPTNQQVLGALNLSCRWSAASPYLMAVAESLGKRIEDRLLALPAGQRLSLLGRGCVRLDGRLLRLPPRQLEILLALSRAPGGLSLEQLYVEVYERDDVHPASLKVEASRLRATLGAEHLGSRPYRLAGGWSCDVDDVLRLLASGDVAGALDLYGSPVLPWSSAPVACRLRTLLQTALREQAFRSADRGLRLRYLAVHTEDAE